jgi:hypothetical protein
LNRPRNPSRPAILFAGGCHIQGYPLGEEFSFAQVVLNKHPEYEPHFLPYQNLKSSDQLCKACNALTPTAIVLQLGHYETPYELRKVIRPPRVLSRTKGASRPQLKPWTADSTQHFRPSLLWELKSFTRFSVGYGMRLLKHPLFDKAKIRKSLYTFLGQLPASLRDRTFILSPFSCPDTLMRLYRLESREVFATASVQFGCHFVDAQSELLAQEESPGDRRLYADPYHLSAEGHVLVGELLARALALDTGQD